MTSIPKNTSNAYKNLALSVLSHSNDKLEKKAVGYKPLSISSPQELITALNTYHCTFSELKNGKRNDASVGVMSNVIKLDVDKEGDALENTIAILDEMGLEYIKVPSQSDMDYKAHIIVMCSNVYHSDHALQLKAGYVIQVEQFLTDSGIDISWLDEKPLFSTSGYLAPASCGGKLTIEEAGAKSVHHEGEVYKLLDLEGNGIVVPEKVEIRNRSSVKGLTKVKGEKFAIKDVKSGKINVLEADNTIYHYGKLIKLKDAVEYIKKQNQTDTIYGGFGCPVCNPKHTLNPKTAPYAFAFISEGNNNGFGGDVVFKCTGNECSNKPLFSIDKYAEKKDAEKNYTVYRVNDHTGSLKMAIYDKKSGEFIKPSEGSKLPYYNLSAGIAEGVSLKALRPDTDERSIKAFLAMCPAVEVIRHGYKKRGFVDGKHGRKIFYDAPVPKFKVEPMDATPIVKEALSIFKHDHKTAGQSTALLIIASYLFAKNQPMAVLGFVGDPASGKTFYAQELIKEYWGAEWVGSIVPDDGAWGDAEFGKRHICYNDVDKMTDLQNKRLTGKIKRRATEGDDGLLNMKGGAIIRSTPATQSVTSNYVSAVPIDAEGKDRRIYIPTLELEGVDHDKLSKAFDPKLGGKQARINRRNLICYLFKIWNDAQKKDKEAMRFMLYVEVPSTDEKKEVMAEALQDGMALLVSIEGKDDFEYEEAIAPYIKEGVMELTDKQFCDIFDGKEPTETTYVQYVSQMIINERQSCDDGKKWYLDKHLLQKVRNYMTAHKSEAKPTLKETAKSFSGRSKFNSLSVNGVGNNEGLKIKS